MVSELLTVTHSDPLAMPFTRIEPTPTERGVIATIAEATGYHPETIALSLLSAGTTRQVWRAVLDGPSPWGTHTFVAKLLPANDREASVLYWLSQKGRFAPRLYDAIPMSGVQQLLLIEDLGQCFLPADWIDRPRLLEGVVAWLSRLARVALPEPLVHHWANWADAKFAVEQFEQSWDAIRERLHQTPGWVSQSQLAALRATYGRRTVLSQRLRPVCRRLCHGDLTPAHICARMDQDGQATVRAADWGMAGRGPIVFDVLDLIWHLPANRFDMALERLHFALPADIRAELTPPVVRLAGELKAYLVVGQLAESWHAAPHTEGDEQDLALQTALTRLAAWQG